MRSGCGYVVGAYHHKHLLGLALQIGLQIVALFSGISSRIASVHDGQILSLRCNECLGPAVHVGNAVSDEQDTALCRSQHLE